MSIPFLYLPLFAGRIVETFLKEGYFTTEIRPVGRDLNEPKALVHRDTSAHARAMTIKANPLISFEPGIVDNSGEKHPADPASSRFRHDIEPLDLGYSNAEPLQPDYPEIIEAAFGNQERTVRRHIRHRQTREFSLEALKGEAKRQRLAILPEKSTCSLDVIDRRCRSNGYRRASIHTDEERVARSVSF